MFISPGCLNEGKSIACALWQKEHRPEEHKEESTSEVKSTANNTITDEVVSEVTSRADTDVSSKSRGSHTDFRNTIVYGLPHIILIPPTS